MHIRVAPIACAGVSYRGGVFVHVGGAADTAGSAASASRSEDEGESSRGSLQPAIRAFSRTMAALHSTHACNHSNPQSDTDSIEKSWS